MSRAPTSWLRPAKKDGDGRDEARPMTTRKFNDGQEFFGTRLQGRAFWFLDRGKKSMDLPARRAPSLWDIEPAHRDEFDRTLDALEQENRRLRDLVVRLTETAIRNIVRRQAG